MLAHAGFWAFSIDAQDAFEAIHVLKVQTFVAEAAFLFVGVVSDLFWCEYIREVSVQVLSDLHSKLSILAPFFGGLGEGDHRSRLVLADMQEVSECVFRITVFGHSGEDGLLVKPCRDFKLLSKCLVVLFGNHHPVLFNEAGVFFTLH